jgi:hypothetical protein
VKIVVVIVFGVWITEICDTWRRRGRGEVGGKLRKTGSGTGHDVGTLVLCAQDGEADGTE